MFGCTLSSPPPPPGDTGFNKQGQPRFQVLSPMGMRLIQGKFHVREIKTDWPIIMSFPWSIVYSQRTLLFYQ